MLQHVHERAHPRVHVALHLEHLRRLHRVDLAAGVGRGLGEIEGGIFAGQRVHVVQERVAVGDRHRLADHHRDDVGMILATLLVEPGRRRGGRELLSLGQPRADPDNDVLERSVGVDDEFFGEGAVGVLAGALFHRRHVNLLGLGRLALEDDLARD